MYQEEVHQRALIIRTCTTIFILAAIFFCQFLLHQLAVPIFLPSLKHKELLVRSTLKCLIYTCRTMIFIFITDKMVMRQVSFSRCSARHLTPSGSPDPGQRQLNRLGDALKLAGSTRRPCREAYCTSRLPAICSSSSPTTSHQYFAWNRQGDKI